MPFKTTLEDGTEVEALTVEEAEKLAAERAQAEADRVAAEKQAEIEERDEKISKLEDKDRNFEKLRKKTESKVEGVGEEVKTQIEELAKKVDQLAEQPKRDIKADFIREHVGEDKEKQELFEYYYSKLGVGAASKDEILKAANEAMTLITGKTYVPDVSASMFTTRADQNYRNDGPKEVSEESKQIGAMLGVTDEDRKKYGKKN